MANTFKGSLSVTHHSLSYFFDLIEFFWYLMERAGRIFF